MGADPTAIRSLAVSAEDVVDAFVYSRENPGTAVLRVTPPFHGRMRARLHVYRVDDAPVTGAIHVAPVDLLEPSVVDAYPALEAYEDRLDETGDPGAVRENRGEDLAAWREDALDGIVETVAIETVDGSSGGGTEPSGESDEDGDEDDDSDGNRDEDDDLHEVSVKRLG